MLAVPRVPSFAYVAGMEHAISFPMAPMHPIRAERATHRTLDRTWLSDVIHVEDGLSAMKAPAVERW